MPKLNPDGTRDYAHEHALSRRKAGGKYDSTKRYARASQRAMRALTRMHPIDYEVLLFAELEAERAQE